MLQLDANTKFKYKICPDSGFLHAIGVIARSGTQDYFGYEIGLTGDDATKIFKVNRPFDEVEKSIPSFNGVFVVDDHPENGIIDTDNFQALTKGTASEVSSYVQDNQIYIIAKVIITDKDLIEKIVNGKKELSAGYWRDIELIDGVYTQTNIKGNHIAVVEEGRCGGLCQISLDKKGEKLEKTMFKVKLGGKNVSLDADQVATHIEELEKEKETLKEDAVSKDASIEELNAKLDEKLAEIEELKLAIENMLTPEQVDELAKETVEIEKDAKELEVELEDKMSNDAKMKLILSKISDNKVSVDSMPKDALKVAYRISVDNAILAKKAQKEGYKGISVDNKTVIVKTGNWANDINATVRELRKGENK